MLPSSPTPAEDPAAALGRFLTGTEAGQVAGRLAAGETLTMALRIITPGRRPITRELLEAVGAQASLLVASDLADGVRAVLPVLRAIEGARSEPTAISPVWTMPGHLAQSGPLTSSVVHLVEHARQSVTCSTFNFQRSSALWTALPAAARQPGITVRVYLDATAASQPRTPGPAAGDGTPTPQEVADHLRPAIVFRSRPFDGTAVRNHAKFLVIDHRFLLVTSANFSWSAENGNIEFGVLHDNRNLADSVEREIRNAEDTLFERMLPAR